MNYQKKISKLVADGKLPSHVGVHHVTVLHDDWCALLTHGGECDCDPEIQYQPGARHSSIEAY
jgi:hypothetical protein